MTSRRLQFRALGPARLSDVEGTSVDSLLAAPKRLALFTYLCGSPGLVGRDALLGLFWADEDQEHARNALNQIVHQIRRVLGHDVLQSRGAEMIGIDPDHVWCDLAAFDAAVGARDHEGALGLYGGELLQGFYLSGAPAFERWLEGERDRKRRQAVAACRELARRGSGDRPEEAVRWLRRGVAIAPNEEVLLRELLVGLDAVGDRSGAVQAYTAFLDRVERDLGMTPSPETVVLLEKILERAAVRRETPLAPAPASAPPRVMEARVSTETGADGPRRPVRRVTTALALLLAGLLAVSFILRLPGVRPVAGGAAPLSDDVILVLPFEIRSSEIAYLGDGMVDLLATALDGDGVPRAVEPRIAVPAWRRLGGNAVWSPAMALELGSATKAGRIVRGSAIETPEGILFTAELLDARTGTTLSSASSHARSTPDGPSELWSAAATLTSRLLAGQLDEGRMLVEGPAPPLPALKDYLAARTAYRRGDAETALERYRSALDRDSTFAYAALGMVEAAQWPAASPSFNEARRHAFRLEHQLRRRDRVYLRAIGGTAYPLASTGPARRVAIEEARQLLPYRPEVQFEVADDLFHSREDPEEASAGFRRTLELDPEFAPALDHLFLLALASGERKEARLLADRYQRLFPESYRARSMDWALARVDRDSAALREFWTNPAELPRSTLIDVFVWSHYLGVPLDDVRRALAVGLRRGSAPRDVVLHYSYLTALNAGRPGEALTTLERGVTADKDPIVAALYSVGDSAPAATRARRLAAEQDVPVNGDKWELAEQAHGTCVLEQWRLWRADDRSTLERSIERIHEAQRRAPDVEGRQNLHHCAALLEGLYATLSGADDAAEKLAVADSIFDLRPDGPQSHYANLLLARLHERRGDRESALERVRDRCWFCLGSVWYLADFLRQEGRLAAALGDREAALKAYAHYLVLRADPEPSVQPQVDSVRREVARLGEGDL